MATQAIGKTILIYAVAALLRRHSVHVGVLGEPARLSPFVDDVVIHNVGDFDMNSSIDSLCRPDHPVRARRPVVRRGTADKTLTDVVTYCQVGRCHHAGHMGRPGWSK
jgi:hypothetical protein